MAMPCLLKNKGGKMKILFAIFLSFSLSLFSDYQTGVKLYNEGKYEDALLRFEELIKEKPDQWQSFYFAALCYQKLNKIEKAKECFEKALKLNDDIIIRLPLAQIYFNEKNYEKVNEILTLEAIQRAKPEQRKSGFKLLATNNYLQGKYKEAIPLFKEYLILDSDPSIKYYLAICLYKTDDLEEASVFLEEIVKANPENNDALSLLASIYLEFSSSKSERKEYYLTQAEKIGEKLLKISEENSYLLAKIKMMLGKYSEASTYFERATYQKDKTQNCYALYYLGFIKAKMENYKGAINSFDLAEKCLKDENALKKIYCQKGLIFHSQSDFKKAIELYKKGSCPEDLIKKAEEGQIATETLQRMQQLLEQLQDLTKMK